MMKKMSHKKIAQKGGNTTLERHGTNHFSKIKKDYWKKIKNEKTRET